LKGCRFYEGLTRVPLIVSWPERVPGGRRCDELVEPTDLVPTLAELAGERLDWTHGRSLLPLLRGGPETGPHRDFVRCEYYDALNMHAPHDPEKHVPAWGTMHHDGRFKLSVYHGLDYGELYDLEHDPDEFENLWEDPAAAQTKLRLLRASFDVTVRCSDPGPRLIGYF
jgi:arylsulfatase A-like enzyme